MPLGIFTLLTAAGSLVWNVALISAGAILGDNWEQVGDVVSLFQTAVVVVIAGLVVWFLFNRFVKPRLVASGDLPPDADEVDEVDADELDR